MTGSEPRADIVVARPSWAALLPPVARVRVAVVAMLLLFVYGGAIRTDLVGRWITDSTWSHGWFIPLFSVYFLWTRRDDLLASRPAANYLGVVVLVLSLALFFVGQWHRMAYPQDVSLLGAIGGVVLLFGGWRVVRVAWLPIVFLMFAIPLPRVYYVSLTLPLQKLASHIAAAIMPLFAPGLTTSTHGVVIDYDWRGAADHLNVAEACSGMRSLMMLTALGVAVAYMDRSRPTWQRVIMIVCCIPIAVLCNMIRVTVTGLMCVYGHQELARGTPHMVLGVATFLIAWGLFELLGFTLARLFVDDDGPAAAAAPAGNADRGGGPGAP
ncbi:MAG: exosortase/archaeosortase family protein [Phycisphaerae bacterium]